MSSHKGGRKHGLWKWIFGGLLGLIIILIALSYLIENDILRSYAERQMNSRLKGYTVRVGHAFIHPIGFALDLKDLTLIQNANPDPPVAKIGRFYASIHWHALLRRYVVGDLLIEYPKLYINLAHFEEEERSTVLFKQKGWQQALEAIFPLKINVLTVRGGEATYVDKGPYRPLHVTDVYLHAYNIRNVSSPESVYPSTLQMEARIFDTGKIKLDGYANFLQEPHIGIKANADLTNMELGYFAPITNRENIEVKNGALSAKGALEYSPNVTDITLKSLDIKGANVEYLHLQPTTEAAKEKAREAAQAAKSMSNEPSAKIRVESITVKESSFGYVNKTVNPPYRIFIDGISLNLKHFSNQAAEGPGTMNLTGKFMGTGDTKVTGSFQSETKSPNLTLNVAIENTQMISMNDLFRAYGDFDIQSGLFSFYSELSVKNNMMQGYVKPIFRDMKVEDRRTPKQKGFFHKMYVGVVKGLTKVLKNRPRQEVATVTTISGPLENPTTSASQTIVNLIRNAFIQSILPGFEREVNQPVKTK